MLVIDNPAAYSLGAGTAVTIGKFDGLHPGHRELIGRTVRRARERGLLAAVFAIGMQETSLLTVSERRQLLGELGVDVLIEMALDPAFLATSAEAFVADTLAAKLHAGYVLTGEDFHFGRGRLGDNALLAEAGGKYGFLTEVVPARCDGEGKISSSRVRGALALGHMEAVARLLGYPYFVTGTIVHGRQLGRTIGVPTANLVTEKSKLLPPHGVYYSRSRVRGETYAGVTNVGTKPTVAGGFVGVETSLFACSGDLYGEEIRTELLHFARPEKRFSSLQALKEQIAEDEAGAAAYFHGTAT